MANLKRPVTSASQRLIRRTQAGLREARCAADEAVYEAFVAGASVREIARCVGISTSTANAMYDRHMARIRAEVKRDDVQAAGNGPTAPHR